MEFISNINSTRSVHPLKSNVWRIKRSWAVRCCISDLDVQAICPSNEYKREIILWKYLSQVTSILPFPIPADAAGEMWAPSVGLCHPTSLGQTFIPFIFLTINFMFQHYYHQVCIKIINKYNHYSGCFFTLVYAYHQRRLKMARILCWNPIVYIELNKTSRPYGNLKWAVHSK